jgi:hypothetical protein
VGIATLVPMDLTKLTKGDRVLAGAGVVFLISTFLAWFEISALGFSVSGSGWDVGFLWGRLPFLIALAMLAWVGVRRFTTAKLPDDIPALYLAGGALVFLLPLLKLVIGEDGPVSRSFGLFLAVLAGAGVAFAGYLKFLEGGGKVDELKGQFASLADQVGDRAKSAVNDAKDTGKKD